jgi:hypothetical protein
VTADLGVLFLLAIINGSVCCNTLPNRICYIRYRRLRSTAPLRARVAGWPKDDGGYCLYEAKLVPIGQSTIVSLLPTGVRMLLLLLAYHQSASWKILKGDPTCVRNAFRW